ncbi:hypothetical protein KAU09_04810 [Candidatus Parcubacteria bacterium]|nr:hypothetical protein [Candidatus Parcubacteria bacterium]
MSNKREKFKKLAETRTSEVLRRIKILGNLANKSAYEYDEKDINKIFSAIENTTREMKSKFKVSKKNNYEFKL